jgi:hypothetical protein
MIRNNAVLSECDRIIREHGDTLPEAMMMAELTEIFREAGKLFVHADDVPEKDGA